MCVYMFSNIFCIYREGIQFALSGVDSDLSLAEVKEMDPPPNIDFLMILNEFSHRLLAVDRTGEKGVIAFLMEHLPEGVMTAVQNKKLEGWDSLLYYYRNTSAPLTGKGRPGVANTSRTAGVSQMRTRKRPLKANGE